MTPAQAVIQLVKWRRWNEKRDQLIGEAWAAGVSKNQIHELSGVARTTIDRVLDKATRPD